eukprot:3184249-Pleurochrysis_carterae.AAC.5
MATAALALSDVGYAHLRSKLNSQSISRLLSVCESFRDQRTRGGYVIWPTVEELPAELRAWSEGEGAEMLLSCLPSGRSVRLTGGAALWKDETYAEATPFHQDKAYRDPAEGEKMVIWLALTHAGPRNGCLRFAPAMSANNVMLPHAQTSRHEGPSGFGRYVEGDVLATASATAEACEVVPGSVVVIGPNVLHGSYGHTPGEPARLAFSPLYEITASATTDMS